MYQKFNMNSGWLTHVNNLPKFSVEQSQVKSFD